MSAPMSARHDGRYLGDGRLLRADRANCHISGGAGIGGVLEPLQAAPTIIEDNCFIGARSEVAEGVIVGEGSVLSMGVYLGAIDQDRRPRHGRNLMAACRPIPSWCRARCRKARIVRRSIAP
jgi:tetrahydrodipicolinate N-succinyltransferase